MYTPNSTDLWNNRYTARSFDAIIEEDIELELAADSLAHASLVDHLHDLGCNAPLVAWANDEVYLDVGGDEDGVAVYSQIAAALELNYNADQDDRSTVNAWLAREYAERLESLLESNLTLAA